MISEKLEYLIHSTVLQSLQHASLDEEVEEEYIGSRSDPLCRISFVSNFLSDK